MRMVVNRLTFAQPIPQSVVDAADEAARLVLDAGGSSCQFVRVDETHAVLVLEFSDVETEQRITSEIGGPWMRANILPLLDGPTDRSSGEVVAGRRR